MISLRNVERQKRQAEALGRTLAFDPVQALAEVDAALAAFPTPDATPTPSPPTIEVENEPGNTTLIHSAVYLGF